MYDSAPRVYLPRPDHLYHNLMSRQQQPKTDLVSAIRNVLAEYDFALVEDPLVLSGGNRSYSLLIPTSQGKKLLKGYHDSMDKSTIVHEHSILMYLAQVDFPSPRLVVTRDGKTLVHQGEDSYALFDFIEGGFQYCNYVLFPGQVRQFITIAGEMLAILHLTLKDFVPQGYNPDGFKSHYEDRWRDMEWIMDKLTHCIAETSRPNASARNSQTAWLLQQARYLEESLVQLDTVLKEAPLPRLTIHADYGPYNILFRKNGPAVILDFEIARLDWRVTDLIDAWYYFCHNKLGFRLNKMQWLLDAYQTHFPLTEDEWQFMPTVWKFLNIWRCILHWHLYYKTGADFYLARAQQHLKRADWMTANQDNLMANLGTPSTYF